MGRNRARNSLQLDHNLDKIEGIAGPNPLYYIIIDSERKAIAKREAAILKVARVLQTNSGNQDLFKS